jgi:hypothetical protein
MTGWLRLVVWLAAVALSSAAARPADVPHPAGSAGPSGALATRHGLRPRAPRAACPAAERDEARPPDAHDAGPAAPEPPRPTPLARAGSGRAAPTAGPAPVAAWARGYDATAPPARLRT